MWKTRIPEVMGKITTTGCKYLVPSVYHVPVPIDATKSQNKATMTAIPQAYSLNSSPHWGRSGAQRRSQSPLSLPSVTPPTLTVVARDGRRPSATHRPATQPPVALTTLLTGTIYSAVVGRNNLRVLLSCRQLPTSGYSALSLGEENYE